MLVRPLLVSLFIFGTQYCWSDTLATDNHEVSYAERWRVTEVEPGAVVTPLKPLWEKSPAWFPRQNRSGANEVIIRRLAATSQGLVTLINRNFYLLDKETGSTKWSFPLKEGVEVTDWKIKDDVIFYTARDWSDLNKKRDWRGAIDVVQRKLLWNNVLVDDEKRYFGGGSFEWVLLLPKQRLLYSTQYSDPFFMGPLDLLDARNGQTQLRMEKGFGYLQDLFLSWFYYDEKLNVFLHPRSGGLQLQSYDLAQGKQLAPVHIYGDKVAGNSPLPYLVQAGNGSTVIFVYEPINQPGALVAYSLKEGKVLWDISLAFLEAQGSRVRQLLQHPSQKNLLIATVSPNRYLLIDTENHVITKQGKIPGYAQWEQFNSVLYSYPYIFAGAHRQTGKDIAYDLVALNVETGKVDWSYENGVNSPLAEILSLVLSDGKVYLSRADGKVLAFQSKTQKQHEKMGAEPD